MKIFSILIFSIVTLLICQCKSKKDHSHFPPDFAFQYKTNVYTYDSRTQLYTRLYLDSIASLRVSLTEKELQSIFGDFQEFEFMNFPEEFECEKYNTFTDPHTTTFIEVSYNKKSRRSRNTSACNYKTQQTNSDNFDRLAGKISKILNSKKEIKNMPESDFVTM
jgi:hypothetical protein